MLIFKKKIIIYTTENGRKPFTEWLEGLDPVVQARILVRLDRVASGNLGDVRDLGEELLELKFSMRSGYRIYFAKDGEELVVLLNGGNKGSQSRDIGKARQYFADYRKQDTEDDNDQNARIPTIPPGEVGK